MKYLKMTTGMIGLIAAFHAHAGAFTCEMLTADQAKTTGSCTMQTMPFSVPGNATPWSQLANFEMWYTSQPGTPVKFGLSSFGIKAGQRLTFICVGGTINVGSYAASDSSPNIGCNGIPNYPINNLSNPMCDDGVYPSAYVDPSLYPVYVGQVIAAFTNGNGVVIGKPFPISLTAVSVVVPTGASNIQFGINDCVFDDNTSGPLYLTVSYLTGQ